MFVSPYRAGRMPHDATISSMIRRLLLIICFGLHASSYGAEPVRFNNDVLPILAEHCFSCHGFDKEARQADLRLDRRDEAEHVLRHSSSKVSPLLKRISSHAEDQRMPPLSTGKSLSDRQVEILQRWIEQGASYEMHWAWLPARKTPIASRGAHCAIDSYILQGIVAKRPELTGLSPAAERAAQLRRITFDLTGLPPTKDEVVNYMQDDRPDAYERHVDRLFATPRFGERWARWWLDLAHYADSDGYLQDFLRPHAWRYRDWVIDSFNADKGFDSFTIEQLAGDLLADDVEHNSPEKRDALSAQISRELRIATGFLRNTLSNREGGADLEEYRVRQVVDRTNTVATTWLGLTMGCAECHDHKFDPITQREFYRFYALFNNIDEVNINAQDIDQVDQQAIEQFYSWRTETLSKVRDELDRLLTGWENKLVWTERNPGADHRWDRHLEILGLIWGQGEGEGQLEGLNIIKTPRNLRSRDQQARLEEYFFQRGSPIDPEKFKTLGLEGLGSTIDKRRATLPKVARAQTIETARRHRPTHLHTRGDFRRPAEKLEPDVPGFLKQKELNVDDRLQFARWLVSQDQPLTARVTVNRLWQELFGRGLVATSENLGIRGSPPTHAELLDHLAVEFMTGEWSIKSILRSLVLSDTYRQTSNTQSKHQQFDRQNLCFARQTRMRLSAEGVRDMTLATSGLLERRIGGPANRPPQPDSVAMEGFDNKWTADTGADRYRRGLYTFLQRTSPFAQSITFDLPETSRTCTRRERSNTPLQALTLLNDPVMMEAAIHLAFELGPSSKSSSSDEDRISDLILRVIGRSATNSEKAKLTQHLNQQRVFFSEEPASARELLEVSAIRQTRDFEPVETAAWAMTISVVMNLDEAITRQ